MQLKNATKSHKITTRSGRHGDRGGGAGGGVTYVGDELARLHGDGLAGGRVDDGRHGGLGAVRYRRSLGRRL